MAMTKKERAEFDAAIERAEILGALRWTQTAPVPRDVPPPGSGCGNYVCGWSYNSYSGTVYKSWSRVVSNGTGVPKEGCYTSGSQGAISQFSTEKLAYQALRHELEVQYAKKLLEIDRKIKALDQKVSDE